MIPRVREWYEKYEGEDFTVISIHYPEFRHEEEIENVIEALDRFDVPYPVAIDNDGIMWRAYDQRFWPTRYILDKQGHIRYKYIGEGDYAQTEAVIQVLMNEPDPVD